MLQAIVFDFDGTIIETETPDYQSWEDSVNGLLAAKRAGLKCVVAPHGMTQHMAFDGADLVLSSLAEVTLERLLAL